MAKIDAFFNLMFEQKASDVHLSSGNNPMLRINGELQRVDHPPLDNDELKKMLYEIAPEYKIKHFEETGDVDFGYEIPNISRFRANFFNQKYGIGAVFRQIPSKVLSFEDFEKFDAPLPAVLKKFAMLHRGLVVVTGPLVPGTLHTPSAAKAVDRIIDVFPAEQQNKIRATLSGALKGVVAQNLFKRIDKKGRVAALEILVFTTAIANLVREGKTHQI